MNNLNLNDHEQNVTKKGANKLTINTLSVGQVDEELRQLSSSEIEQIYGGHRLRTRYYVQSYAQVGSGYVFYR